MPEVRILRQWVDDPDQYQMDRAFGHGYYTTPRRAAQERAAGAVMTMCDYAGVPGAGRGSGTHGRE